VILSVLLLKRSGGVARYSSILDDIKDLGFRTWRFKGGLSFNLGDVIHSRHEKEAIGKSSR
jgi:hypothetical protein